jgi:hypothetical protein
MKNLKQINRALLAVILIAFVLGMASCSKDIVVDFGPDENAAPEESHFEKYIGDNKFLGLSFNIGAEWERNRLDDPGDLPAIAFFCNGDADKAVFLTTKGHYDSDEEFYDNMWETLKERALRYGYDESDVTMEDWTNGYVSGKSYMTPEPEFGSERWIIFCGDGNRDPLFTGVFSLIYNPSDDDELMNKSIEKFINSIRPTDEEVQW